MKAVSVLPSIVLTGLIMIFGTGCVERRGDTIVLSGETYEVVFSARDGSILSLGERGKNGSILKSGEYGLWDVRFRDGSEVSAADFKADASEGAFRYEIGEAANVIRMLFDGPEIGVTVTATGRKNGVDFSARVNPKDKTVLDFALPARLRFDPDQVERFVFPIGGNYSVGVAFNAAFFMSQDEPAGWDRQGVGPKGYVALYGGPLNQRPDHDPPTPLHVTEEGRKWFDARLAGQIEGAKAVVNRPPTRAQADLVLVDSVNGPYFSASHIGGKGLIWRIGGGVGEEEKQIVTDMVTGAIERLLSSAPAGRSKLGLVSLKRGPDRCGWAAVLVSEWRARLRRCRTVAGGKVRLVELATPKEMMDALNADDFLVILNPYGEWAPVLEEGGMTRTVEAIGRYVRAGGNWFEVGGYPFYYQMRPRQYLSIERKYPNAFADLLHLDARPGSVSIYGVQPQKWPPWEGANDKEAIFVPGRLACGGDEHGGYCSRWFATYVAPKDTWQSPTVRLSIGNSAVDDIQAYCEANEIKRKLEDKMSPELLDKFKKSVVLSYGGNCRDKIASLELLPVPTFLFFADYLKGGFDKEYPDHLPPRPDFGTPEEFRAFIDKARELGHLVMPYTNPTWWCDHPRGPTFKREGEEPLLRKLDGKLSYESYGRAKNDGYTVCHWHPAVQAANRKTVRQFTEEYPVSVLFQDQNGARSWRYDMNPASPTPYAYFDGLISQVAEDYTKGTPLSTEGGYDRLVNYESQFSGLSFDLVPLRSLPRWIRLFKCDYPPKTWQVFPVALYIAHDKTAMIHHFMLPVVNEEVLAWTMGIGFSLNYGSHATSSLAKDEWFKWLDRLQKSACARYVGEPLRAFEHDRGPNPTVEDDGVLRATYDKIKVITNVGPVPRRESGRDLAPYGFYMTGPGLVAANLKTLSGVDFGDEGISFVAEGNAQRADVWVFASGEQEVAVELPTQMSGDVSVSVENRPAVTGRVRECVANFRLPSRSGRKRLKPPVALAGKAPRDWPGDKLAVGVVDFGKGVKPTWTQITPSDWIQAFSHSRLAKELNVPIRRITTVAELEAALKAGPTKWLTIINPYGEAFPASGPGKWREMLDMIRNYVNNGGCWWETGGYSFYLAISPEGDGWQSEHVGPAGMSHLGLPVGGGEVDQSAEALTVTAEGRTWLGAELSANVENCTSAVNRGLSRGSRDPGHVTLVAAEEQDFIGGYRLDGWGWLWRIGGFWPNRDVALPVAVAATEYIYTYAPAPVKPGGIKYLWHVVVKSK